MLKLHCFKMLLATVIVSVTLSFQATTVVHITDLHAGGAEKKVLLQTIYRVELKKPDLVIATGDLVNCGMQTFCDQDAPEVMDYDDLDAVLRKEWLCVPGNHEYAWAGYTGAAQFEKRVGLRHGIRDIGGWRFIGVDFGVPYFHEAFIAPQELQWLENALKSANGMPCVLCLHQPPFFFGQTEHILNQEQLKPLFARYSIRLVLAGHTHKNSIYTAYGVPVIVTGAAFEGWYSTLNFQGNKVDVTIKNGLKTELPAVNFTLYDKQGKLDTQGFIKNKAVSPENIANEPHASRMIPESYMVERAAIYAPVVRKKDCLYFSNSMGHRWELRLPPVGQKFTQETFRASLKKIGDFKGNLAFTFFDLEGQACSLSDHGQLIFPDKEIDLNRIISCQPVVWNDTLVIGTLAGTVIFYDLKEKQVRQEVDFKSFLAVSGIAADQSGIYACSMDETIRGIDWDGKKRWINKLTRKNYSYSAYPASPLAVNGIVYVTSNDNKTLAFSTQDGTKRWEQETGKCNTFTPLGLTSNNAFPEQIVVGNRDGLLAAFNPLSGEKTILWNSAGLEIRMGAVQGKNIFLYCWNGTVVQWNPETVRIWKFNLSNQQTSHPPIPLDREVLLPCWNGTFLSFQLENISEQKL
jgi:predicted phosphodiesterase